MRALTLWQPYATAIAVGLKRVETRPPWAMQLAKCEGERIAIHAAKAQPPDTPEGRTYGRYHLRTVGRTGWALEGPGLPPFQATPRVQGVLLPFGRVVATARIGAVVPIRGDDAQYDTEPGDWIVDSSRWYPGTNLGSLRRITTRREGSGVASWVDDLADQEPWGDWTPGRVAIVLDDVRELDHPVAVRGYQRLWTIRGDAAARVMEQVA